VEAEVRLKNESGSSPLHLCQRILQKALAAADGKKTAVIDRRSLEPAEALPLQRTHRRKILKICVVLAIHPSVVGSSTEIPIMI
jgi:hypothetical protein